MLFQSTFPSTLEKKLLEYSEVDYMDWYFNFITRHSKT